VFLAECASLRNGTAGEKGDRGDPGPPFNGNATFTGVFVNGTTVCAEPMDRSCLGPGGCLNFSLCVLTAEGLNLFGTVTS
jgi:hypothetical protein